MGIAGVITFAIYAPARAQEAKWVTVTDYLSASLYPTLVGALNFANDKWDLNKSGTQSAGNWSVKFDQSDILLAKYSPKVKADDFTYVKITGFCLDKTPGSSGAWFSCALNLIDARGVAGAKGDKLCGFFLEPDGDRSLAIECPISLGLASPEYESKFLRP
jgi:hypothetical protein